MQTWQSYFKERGGIRYVLDLISDGVYPGIVANYYIDIARDMESHNLPGYNPEHILPWDNFCADKPYEQVAQLTWDRYLDIAEMLLMINRYDHAWSLLHTREVGYFIGYPAAQDKSTYERWYRLAFAVSILLWFYQVDGRFTLDGQTIIYTNDNVEKFRFDTERPFRFVYEALAHIGHWRGLRTPFTQGLASAAFQDDQLERMLHRLTELSTLEKRKKPNYKLEAYFYNGNNQKPPINDLDDDDAEMQDDESEDLDDYAEV